MKIYVIRHPQTYWNEQKRIQGHKDSPLTQKGILTAHNLGTHLANKGITKIYSSDLGRCMQTAKIVNQYIQAEIIPEKDFRERNFGIYNGSLYDELISFEEEDVNHKMLHGESMNDMQTRVLNKLKEVAQDNILLVLHHGGVRSIVAKAKNVNFKSKEADPTKKYYILVIDINNDNIQVESIINTVKPHKN